MTDAERDASGAGHFEVVVGTLVEDEMQATDAERRDIQTLPRVSRKGQDLRMWQLPHLWMPTEVSVVITY
jgi:hypothetical protein